MPPIVVKLGPVRLINAPPVWVSVPSPSFTQGVAANFPASGTYQSAGFVTDAEGNPIALAWNLTPVNGVSWDGGRFIYNGSGSGNIAGNILTATDGQGNSVPSSVFQVTITAVVNQAPVWGTPSPSFTEGITSSYSLPVTDAEGDPMSATVGPTSAAFPSWLTVLGLPPRLQATAPPITTVSGLKVQVNDGHGHTVESPAFSVNVAASGGVVFTAPDGSQLHYLRTRLFNRKASYWKPGMPMDRHVIGKHHGFSTQAPDGWFYVFGGDGGLGKTDSCSHSLKLNPAAATFDYYYPPQGFAGKVHPAGIANPSRVWTRSNGDVWFHGDYSDAFLGHALKTFLINVPPGTDTAFYDFDFPTSAEDHWGSIVDIGDTVVVLPATALPANVTCRAECTRGYGTPPAQGRIWFSNSTAGAINVISRAYEIASSWIERRALTGGAPGLANAAPMLPTPMVGIIRAGRGTWKWTKAANTWTQETTNIPAMGPNESHGVAYDAVRDCAWFIGEDDYLWKFDPTITPVVGPVRHLAIDYTDHPTFSGTLGTIGQEYQAYSATTNEILGYCKHGGAIVNAEFGVRTDALVAVNVLTGRLRVIASPLAGPHMLKQGYGARWGGTQQHCLLVKGQTAIFTDFSTPPAYEGAARVYNVSVTAPDKITSPTPIFRNTNGFQAGATLVVQGFADPRNIGVFGVDIRNTNQLELTVTRTVKRYMNCVAPNKITYGGNGAGGEVNFTTANGFTVGGVVHLELWDNPANTGTRTITAMTPTELTLSGSVATESYYDTSEGQSGRKCWCWPAMVTEAGSASTNCYEAYYNGPETDTSIDMGGFYYVDLVTLEAGRAPYPQAVRDCINDNGVDDPICISYVMDDAVNDRIFFLAKDGATDDGQDTPFMEYQWLPAGSTAGQPSWLSSEPAYKWVAVPNSDLYRYQNRTAVQAAGMYPALVNGTNAYGQPWAKFGYSGGPAYRQESGTLFIHGNGGSLSALASGNGWRGNDIDMMTIPVAAPVWENFVPPTNFRHWWARSGSGRGDLIDTGITQPDTVGLPRLPADGTTRMQVRYLPTFPLINAIGDAQMPGVRVGAVGTPNAGVAATANGDPNNAHTNTACHFINARQCFIRFGTGPLMEGDEGVSNACDGATWSGRAWIRKKHGMLKGGESTPDAGAPSDFGGAAHASGIPVTCKDPVSEDVYYFASIGGNHHICRWNQVLDVHQDLGMEDYQSLHGGSLGLATCAVDTNKRLLWVGLVSAGVIGLIEYTITETPAPAFVRSVVTTYTGPQASGAWRSDPSNGGYSLVYSQLLSKFLYWRGDGVMLTFTRTNSTSYVVDTLPIAPATPYVRADSSTISVPIDNSFVAASGSQSYQRFVEDPERNYFVMVMNAGDPVFCFRV